MTRLLELARRWATWPLVALGLIAWFALLYFMVGDLLSPRTRNATTRGSRRLGSRLGSTQRQLGRVMSNRLFGVTCA